jgi:mRNA interferase MazF
VIRQGELYWLDLGVPIGSAPGYRRPYVIVQNDVFNDSGLASVVVCALTTSARRAGGPGNVVLRQGEGGLPRQSVVNVTELSTVDRSQLEDRIGTLSRRRVEEIIDGIRLVLEPVY